MKKILCILVVILIMYQVSAQTITDTAALRTAINTDIVPNAAGGITATKLNRILLGGLNSLSRVGVTSFYRRADSVFYVKAGTESFAFIDSAGSSGGTYTASNGLTMTANNTKLGGALIDANTVIDLNGKALKIRGNPLIIQQSATLDNIFINGGNNTATQGDAIVIGSSSGSAIDSCADCIIIGKGAAPIYSGSTNVYPSVLIGGLTGQMMNDSSFNNHYIGHRVGRLTTSGNYNIGMGISALENCNGCSNNIAIGTDNQLNNTGSNNTSIGIETMTMGFNNNGNIAIGRQALHNIDNSQGNMVIGINAYESMTSGDYNTRLGGDVIGTTRISGSRNTEIGFQASASDGTGDDNISIGYRAGFNETSSTRNIFIGSYTNSLSAADSGNIAIGSYCYTTAGNGRLNIGSVLWGTGMHNSTSDSYTPEAGGKIGIGTVDPDSAFHLVGGFKYANGSQGADKVLTSDANGGATWAAVSVTATNTVNLTNKNIVLSIVTKTASDTLELTDAGKSIEMNVASGNSLSIPTNASVAFPIGTQIIITQLGAGQTQFVALAGVTIRSSGSKLKITDQYSGATLIKRDTNEWVLFGNLSL